MEIWRSIVWLRFAVFINGHKFQVCTILRLFSDYCGDYSLRHVMEGFQYHLALWHI